MDQTYMFRCAFCHKKMYHGSVTLGSAAKKRHEDSCLKNPENKNK